VRGRSTANEFAIAATAHHYNPFAFKTDGTTAWASGAHNGTAWPVGTGSSANIDTATSLGLDAWVSTNYYKPYNGGRVVKWVASDGTIKTSVNMMPPNARSIANSASLTNGTEKGDDSAGTSSAAVANDTFYPTFTDIAIDHSQAEVAKTFYPYEFGNGSANGSATYADASTLATTTANVDIAYVMDDGLTSLSCDDAYQDQDSYGAGWLGHSDNGDKMYITFIGTGLSLSTKDSGAGGSHTFEWVVDGVNVYGASYSGSTSQVNHSVVQNLPYGTHILMLYRNSATIAQNYSNITFHQPKRPPIPEDAVVLADYMLMADFVAIGARGIDKFSKGVRYQHATRDVLYDADGAWTFNTGTPNSIGCTQLYKSDTSTTNKTKLPFFGSGIIHRHQGRASDGITLGYTNNGTNFVSPTAVGEFSSNQINENSGADSHYGAYAGVSNLALEQYTLQAVSTTASSSDYHRIDGLEIATPIHTSHHYQSFETPFLHELVGGDRNMEQTNLVVTPDGKTWDEVTRDVSYIGSKVFEATTDTNYIWANVVIFDTYRGSGSSGADFHNKDFAIAYDRHICLRDGQYRIHIQSSTVSSGDHNLAVQYNTTGLQSADFLIYMIQGGTTVTRLEGERTINMKRGDYLRVVGCWGDAEPESHHQYSISRV
jgi:hypothetical protein